MLFRIFFAVCIVAWGAVVSAAPLKLEINQGVIEPVPFAVPAFVPETSGAEGMAQDLAQVVAADLLGTGLFREIPQSAFVGAITSFSSPVQFSDWKVVNAQVLISGAVSIEGSNITVKFRIYDVFAGNELGSGMRFSGQVSGWRRMAHKISDAVYSRITGEAGYFDSRVVFVSESGAKSARKKSLAIMDYDGANVQYLTNDNDLVLAPRFSPTGDRILYTSYETGFPRIYLLEVNGLRKRALQDQPGTMSFAPRFSPDGQSVVYSLERNGNTDLYEMNLASGQMRQLSNAPSIETAPSYSPDGTQIVFESDRSGTQQIYVMDRAGGTPKRISFGDGRYGTPVWSPRGDMIAFTKQKKGRFHIGVMRTDGSEERLLTASFLDEGPTWSPNGRVIMFTRETQGASGVARLYSVDVSGRNLKPVPTPGGGSDPAWSPLGR